jgi:hypothetical protein
MKYRKLNRVWSFGHLNYIPNFDKVFPELGKLSNDEMLRRFRELGLEFYAEKLTPVPFWVRLTLPFALILMLLMLIVVPINFLVTGKWSYSLGEKNRILNWFKSLRLL